jgi:hypothetical protein
MARDPGSLWSPLIEADSQGSYPKTQFIVHSTGDRLGAAATFEYFNGATENESTFVVGASPDDPTRQLLDSSARADANVAANRDAIAVEVVGEAGDDYTPWQTSELIRLGLWARTEHPGILPQTIATPTGPGYGWHVMFGAPGPWTTAAKECPGRLRISRLQASIFPAIFATTTPATAGPDDDGDDVFKLYTAKGDGTVYFGGPGVWTATPNSDWMTTAHLTLPSLQLVQLPTKEHLNWARDFCLHVLTGERNSA